MFFFLSACEYSRWPTLSRFPLSLTLGYSVSIFPVFADNFLMIAIRLKINYNSKMLQITWWKTSCCCFSFFFHFFFTVSFCFVLCCFVFSNLLEVHFARSSYGGYTHSLLFDCYVSISRTLKIPFISVTLADLAHCKDSLYSDCNVSISRTVKFLFCWIVTLVSRAL